VSRAAKKSKLFLFTTAQLLLLLIHELREPPEFWWSLFAGEEIGERLGPWRRAAATR